MREWELQNPVDCAVSLCDCLNYLTEEEDIHKAFQQTYHGLSPGSLFIFDMHTAQQLIDYTEAQPYVMNEEDISYIWTCEYDEKRMEIEHNLAIFSRDHQSPLYRKIEETHVQRAYPTNWIKNELESVGFEVLSISADFTFDPPTETSERLFFVARRPNLISSQLL